MQRKKYNNQMPTTTYQGILMRALLDVVMSRNNGDLEAFWTSLVTLYLVSPQNVIEDLGENLNKTLENYKNIKVIGRDRYVVARTLREAAKEFKVKHADLMFQEIMASLHKNNWTVWTRGARPLSENTPHIGINTQ